MEHIYFLPHTYKSYVNVTLVCLCLCFDCNLSQNVLHDTINPNSAHQAHCMIS
jgi:hypothetical protein